ncbi:MAG: hypothetical protein K0U08_05445 [Proteobacteria bacterium]|nr:hypothetical protein [Pseudomonadota bacterium]
MSTKTKFTKGEWRVVGNTFIYALNDNEVNQFTCLVQTSVGGANDEELMANAHLMAAAPKMYKGLEFFIEYLKCLILDTETKEEVNALNHKINEINQLLAEARGE